MSSPITRTLDRFPSHPLLCKLAQQHGVRVTGDARAGSFSGHGVEGRYAFGDDHVHGTFAGHGVTGEFSLGRGQAAVTITRKPFWLPETLLNERIGQGLDALRAALASQPPE
ncbi:MAG: hypothetical protein JXQ71_08780 [Verrucomicrobia bacterium]|nr:hypothetical protein [Verrucomicrobiota bacterium]